METYQVIRIPREVDFILNRLYEAGYEAYIVGGAIRDWLLKKRITDWDITTSATSDTIKRIFRDRTIFSLKHDTVTVVIKGKNYEITPFKGDHLMADLLHRDFTINAMAYDPKRKVLIDPINGRCDLEKKIIRATVDPYARILEDPLRMLRAIRFSVELDFKIHKKTIDAIGSLSYLINNVSKERIRDELLKLLISHRPSQGIRLMCNLGLMRYIIPELIESQGIRQNKHHRYTVFNHILIALDMVEPKPVLRLSALFHDIGKPRTKKKINRRVTFRGHEEKSANMAKAIMRRLRFSKEMIERVSILVKEHMINYRPEWGDAAIRRLIKRVGRELIILLISLRKADLMAHGVDKEDELILLKELEGRVKREIDKGFIYSLRDLKINGYAIMKELGLSQGPEVGRILKKLYEKVLENPELNRPDILISIAKKLKEPSPPLPKADRLISRRRYKVG